MASESCLARLKRGVVAWNKWQQRRLKGIEEADLSDANLFGAQLSGVDFRKVDLTRCDLRSANLSGANFRGARLHRTRLSGAILVGSNFGLPLAEVDSTEVTVMVGLEGTKTAVCGPNVADAIFGYSQIDGINLQTWTDLQHAKHMAPSTLSIRTLFASEGKLPVEFLRGCGLPEILIDYLPSLAGSPMQFNSCFISYSTADEEFARKLHSDLQSRGVRCWFAGKDIRAGQSIVSQIDRAISVHDRLIVVLSRHSIESSWVRFEILRARSLEGGGSPPIVFPVSLVPYPELKKWRWTDSDSGEDVAKYLRSLVIPDFSDWTNRQKYNEVFEQLLLGLSLTNR